MSNLAVTEECPRCAQVFESTVGSTLAERITAMSERIVMLEHLLREYVGDHDCSHRVLYTRLCDCELCVTTSQLVKGRIHAKEV